MEENQEVYLDLEFEIDDFEGETDDEDSSSSEEESDVDEGEVGEYAGNGGSDGSDSDAAVGYGARAEHAAAALAYQHEPLPPVREFDDAEHEQNIGDARPRGNLDHTRLDPNSTDIWCRCGGFCRVLPSFSVGDCICCREIEEVRFEADFHDDLHVGLCITQVPSFDAAILDPVSLFIAWQHFTERWRRQARSFAARNNEKYRYVAYRQFVRWCWGILGKDIRVQLPACVQSRIKTAYPDGAGHYKGTVLRQLDMN
ncbi:uncharacterized protein LOC121428454 [Lytechinus variegatus]|uniref:uncharacterized protein LOC121428454 n=1 Tax=Lytechinus variegatus TaxID=7654 RepID=UPI001BB1EC29|nr:uncharacterized protein LOC121428454 [Lytechinus variegatus]